MHHTFEAVIDEHGKIRPIEAAELPAGRRALVTVLDDEEALLIPETALLSEPALAEDWDRPEEDDAWAYLQSEQ